MADYEQFRVFVGGLSWEMNDRDLEDEFRRFGKVLEAKVMLDRDTGRPRGFGFVTFAEKRGMDEAINRLHDRELDGRVVSVTKAQPKIWSGEKNYNYRDDYDNGGGSRGGYGSRGGGGSGGGAGGGGRDDCFKCGQPGHWARDCPMGDGGGGGGRFSSRDRYGSGGGGGRDRYGSGGGSRYSGRDRDGDRGYDRYDNGYGRYGDRDSGRGSDRYGSGGPARYEGRYRERAGPYDRLSGGGGRSAYDDRY